MIYGLKPVPFDLLRAFAVTHPVGGDAAEVRARR